MDHRRFLAHPETHRPFADGDLFGRIGGQAAIDGLVDGLYDRIEADVALRPLFGRDLSRERAAQKRFFADWLGGAGGYRTHLPLKHRHDLLPITRALAGKWLAHFRDSLDAAVSDAGARRAVYDHARQLAMALVNEEGAPSALRARSHGTCLRYEPAVAALDLSRRGDAVRLRALLERAPDVLASTPLAARLLHLAVLAGRAPVVEILLAAGVDVDLPSPIETLIFATPLCAARMRRRGEVEAILLRRGAKEDIFTHAFLGNVQRLEEEIAHSPSSAQAVDPAVDALEITPVHHAVAGERVEALRLLISRASRAREPLRNLAAALDMAVAHENAAMVSSLIEQGANAASLGAGRWVLHPELAPLLSRAGARVDRSGSWIGLSCTGNRGRRDDPEYVTALLRHGARANDRRLTGQDADGGRAPALHYAAKAGFVKTIEVLLEHGAHPGDEDDNGRTALDWLERAARSVNREAVRRLLVGGRVRSAGDR
jgi:truncated hemoglobin YjbI/ankyrin repeat protein